MCSKERESSNVGQQVIKNKLNADVLPIWTNGLVKMTSISSQFAFFFFMYINKYVCNKNDSQRHTTHTQTRFLEDYSEMEVEIEACLMTTRELI